MSRCGRERIFGDGCCGSPTLGDLFRTLNDNYLNYNIKPNKKVIKNKHECDCKYCYRSSK